MTLTTPIKSPTGQVFASVALATSLLSCTFDQQLPPPYDASDNIGNIPTVLVIGKWQSTPLNSPTNAPNTTTVIEYRSDGSLQGTIQTTRDDTTGTPALQLELTGSWTTEGEWLRHSDVGLKAVGDSPYARQYNQVFNASTQEFGSVTNVLELDEERMITISKDGRATLYTRQ